MRKFLVVVMVVLAACTLAGICGAIGLLALPEPDVQTDVDIVPMLTATATMPVPMATPLATAAPTVVATVVATPLSVATPTLVTAPPIGKVYDVPWGSMLCELPGDAALDWAEPGYCTGGIDYMLDVLDQGVTLTGSEGAWCYVEGEYMALMGDIELVEGWVACRFLSIP